MQSTLQNLPRDLLSVLRCLSIHLLLGLSMPPSVLYSLCLIPNALDWACSKHMMELLLVACQVSPLTKEDVWGQSCVALDSFSPSVMQAAAAMDSCSPSVMQAAAAMDSC